MRINGKRDHIRSDNWAEFTARLVMRWLPDEAIGPAFISPGKLWQCGFVGSFNGKLRDELLNREWFRTLAEAKVMIEAWRWGFDSWMQRRTCRTSATGASRLPCLRGACLSVLNQLLPQSTRGAASRAPLASPACSRDRRSAVPGYQ